MVEHCNHSISVLNCSHILLFRFFLFHFFSFSTALFSLFIFFELKILTQPKLSTSWAPPPEFVCVCLLVCHPCCLCVFRFICFHYISQQSGAVQLFFAAMLATLLITASYCLLSASGLFTLQKSLNCLIMVTAAWIGIFANVVLSFFASLYYMNIILHSPSSFWPPFLLLVGQQFLFSLLLICRLHIARLYCFPLALFSWLFYYRTKNVQLVYLQLFLCAQFALLQNCQLRNVNVAKSGKKNKNLQKENSAVILTFFKSKAFSSIFIFFLLFHHLSYL